MRAHRSLGRAGAVAALLLATAAPLPAGPGAGGTAALASATTATPLFPGVGTTDLDVRAYRARLAYRPGTGRLQAHVTITARATRTLDQVQLDYTGPAVSRATVDGEPATVTQADAHLTVTPTAPVDGRFTLRVTYEGRPGSMRDDDGSREGWVRTADGAVALGEPLGTRTWLPVNDTPADKARVELAVTVPAPATAVAGGTLVRTRSGTATLPGASAPQPVRTWTWRQQSPVAPHLVLLAIGRFRQVTREVDLGAGRTVTARFFEDAEHAGAAAARDVLPTVLRFLQRRFGPYPFATTGHLLDDAHVGYALETQTLPFYPVGPVGTRLVVHEQAHQWFGDAVGVRDWHDLWLAEGLATYAEWLWTGAHGGLTPATHFARLYARPASAPLWSPAPTTFTDPADLFGDPVYLRGAMTVQALRERIGGRDLLRVLRGWVRRHTGGTATTAGFEALAERVSGQDLSTFFDDWLRTDGKPAGY
ncbi:M1 family metallopeptidase [Nocardioides sp. GY 10127]|uniref:M1 family metallopeptidase n=1 Tax=Nocardioides sp. GY 10127 TaxID=2569762 RepID=UPI0010A83BF4|nr:M1 family metallopeptidase [Nocardioides sp. GY 10127]TIC82951.1 M1 family metallopeptidase [Nocardioides sp. GY 10127]